MKIVWNEYTWYSKLLAAVFFVIILPAWTFYLGTQYQETVQVIEQSAQNIDNNLYISTPVAPKSIVLDQNKNLSDQAIVASYLNSDFRVVKIVKSDVSPYFLVITTEREKGDSNSRNDDTACGSIYTEKTCYFFLEPDYVYGAHPLKYIGQWTGGLDSLSYDSPVSFVDENNIQFETQGGDAGNVVDVIRNLNIQTGKVTTIEDKSSENY